MQSQKPSTSPQPSTDFGAGGSILQDIGNILQVGVSGGDTVERIDLGNESAHWKEAEGISP